MIKLEEKYINQSITRLNLDDNVEEILVKNGINTLGILCNETKANLKEKGLQQGEIRDTETKLQLMGLNLKNNW